MHYYVIPTVGLATISRVTQFLLCEGGSEFTTPLYLPFFFGVPNSLGKLAPPINVEDAMLVSRIERLISLTMVWRPGIECEI